MAKRPATTRPKSTDAANPAPPKARKTKAPPAAAPDAAGGGAQDAAAEPSAEDIRRRAYERYQQRGGNHGRHFDDWLEAEKELKTKK